MASFDAAIAQRTRRRNTAVALLGAAVAIAVAAALARRGVATSHRFELLAILMVAAAAAVVVWLVDPAYSLSAVLCLTMFSGHWSNLGLRANIAPDRFLFVLVVAAVLLRAPGARRRPDIVLGPVHAALALATLFVVVSALIAGTLIDHLGTFRLLDRFGVIPFAAFVIAPVVYRTRSQRAVLIGALVALGAYLSLMAVFQTIGALNALVYPRYIVDAHLTVHLGRARGPFINAAVNGIALYACATACVMAAVWARRPWVRLVAVPVGVLCTISLLFTLTRSIWIGAAIAGALTLVFVRELRRYALPALVGVAVAVAAALALVPGFATHASARRADAETVVGRANLNAAALDMLEQRPLFGFGWATYEKQRDDHIVLPADRAVIIRGNPPEHNLLLSNLAELGLVGTTLWLTALGLALAGAFRGPPLEAVRPWRIMLLSVVALYALVALASPLEGQFQHMLVWLLAGVVWGMTLPERQAEVARETPC